MLIQPFVIPTGKQITLNEEVNGATSDKTSFAEEVLVSAARQLFFGDLTPKEINEAFRKAAERAANDELLTTASQSVAPESAVHDLESRFDALPAVKLLQRLAKRSSALRDLNDQSSLEKIVPMLFEALRLRSEALEWLAREAPSKGFSVARDRDEWLESADDEELDEEPLTVFLWGSESWEDFDWYLVGQTARALARAGEHEQLLQLDEAVRSGFPLGRDQMQEINTAKRVMASYSDFRRFLKQQRGRGEVRQATLLDDFIASHAFEDGAYYPQQWIEHLSDKGEIMRYKKSNRWCITF